MGEWISVEDRLPEVGAQVLMYTDNGIVGGCYDKDFRSEVCFQTGYACDAFCCYGDFAGWLVRYWMPAPDEPNENDSPLSKRGT